MNASSPLRVLIAHPDTDQQAILEGLMRDVVLNESGDAGVTPFCTASLVELPDTLRRIEPHILLIDLSQQRQLALDIVRGLELPNLHIIGLYNPITLGRGERDLLRQASRAGVHDFMTMPVSMDELKTVLAPFVISDRDGKTSEGRVITFYATRGGAGTTSLAANVGCMLARELSTKRVLLIDADLQFGNAATHLGLPPERHIGELVRDLSEAPSLDTYISRHAASGLYLLAAPPDLREGLQINPESWTRVLIQIRRNFDLVLIDTPSTLDALITTAFDLSSQIWLLSDAVLPHLNQTRKFNTLLNEMGYDDHRIRLAINRMENFQGYVGEPVIQETLKRQPDALIPFDAKSVDCISRGEPIALERPRSAYAKAISLMMGCINA